MSRVGRLSYNGRCGIISFGLTRRLCHERPPYFYAAPFTTHGCRLSESLLFRHILRKSQTPLLAQFPDIPQEVTARPVKKNGAYFITRASDATVERRLKTLWKITRLMREEFGPGYNARLFGSICYGADSEGSELHIMILDHLRTNGHDPNRFGDSKLPRLYLAGQLARTLRDGGFRKINLLGDALVPIVKCYDPETEMLCTVNVNERSGYMSTALVRRYCELYPVLSEVIYHVKMWAKGQSWGFNSLHTYTLALMSVGVFQNWGLLPNLQQPPFGVDADDPKSFIWARPVRGAPVIKCDTRFNMHLGWKPPRQISIEQGFRGWMRYWGYEHQYNTHMMSIKRGGTVPREHEYTGKIVAPQDPPSTPSVEAGTTESRPGELVEPLPFTEPSSWAEDLLCVQEPFMTIKNLGHALNTPACKNFIRACRETADSPRRDI